MLNGLEEAVTLSSISVNSIQFKLGYIQPRQNVKRLNMRVYISRAFNNEEPNDKLKCILDGNGESVHYRPNMENGVITPFPNGITEIYVPKVELHRRIKKRCRPWCS